jgi:threonine/homoserine/homoserine lactone efflux protein
MAGASLTFGVMLAAGVLGLSLVAPRGVVFRVLELAGGAFLVLVAADGFRNAHETPGAAAARPGLPPALRGTFAVLLNPGAWLFLATSATSLLAAAAREGGRLAALECALALLAGAASGDAALVLLGATSLRRGGAVTRTWVRRTLAVLLAAVGGWMVLEGLLLRA